MHLILIRNHINFGSFKSYPLSKFLVNEAERKLSENRSEYHNYLFFCLIIFMKTGSKSSPHVLRSSIILARNKAVSLVEPSGRIIFFPEFFPNNPRTDFFSSC